MGHWNYRIIKCIKEAKIGKTDYTDVVYRIHEVHYDEQDKIKGWTQDPIHPLGETVDELKSNLEQMMEAFKKPILIKENGKLIEIT